jgi:hypothetical protein
MWFQKRRVALAASPPPRRLGEGGGSGSGFLVPTDPTGAIPDPEEIKRAICRALYGHIDEGDDPHVVHYHPESGAHFVQTYPLPIRGQLTGQSGSAQL